MSPRYLCSPSCLPSCQAPGSRVHTWSVTSNLHNQSQVPAQTRPELLLPPCLELSATYPRQQPGAGSGSQCAHHMQYEVLQSVMMLWGLRCANISCIRGWTMSSDCIGLAGGSNMWYVHRRLSGENECEIMQYSVINLCKMFKDGQYALMPEAPLAGFWNAMYAMENIKLFRRSCSK